MLVRVQVKCYSTPVKSKAVEQCFDEDLAVYSMLASPDSAGCHLAEHVPLSWALL